MQAIRKVLIVSLTLVSLVFFSCEKKQAGVDQTEKRVKAGFIYIGPVGDSGWSYAHDVGRKAALEKLPWLDTVYVESVSETDSPRIIDKMILDQKCQVIFTTSFGYMNYTVDAAQKYPQVKFMHCSGFKQKANLGTYFIDLYQMYYLNGLLAGALSKSGKIGYVGAFPIPEVIRHINAFALGAQTVNPQAKISVKWINSWYAPDKAREAAESFITEGCDTLAFTEDSPSVIEVGQEHTETGTQIYTFSHYSPMQKFGPNTVVSGQLVDWGVLYTYILNNIYSEAWTNEDLWWLADKKAALLGGSFDNPINPQFVDELKAKMITVKDLGEISTYDLVMARYKQMQESPKVFEPFTGPITDNSGALRLKDGQTATRDDLLNMLYYVNNVIGSIPTTTE